MAKDRTKGTGKKCPPGCPCGKHKRHVRPEQRGRKLSPEHKEKLRQASLGKKMTEAHKKKISEEQIRRYRRGEQLMPYKIPTKKRCPKCKKTKDVDPHFSVRPRKIKSGDIRYYVEIECRKCVAKRTKAWREKKRKEGRLLDLQKGYRDNVSPEKKDERREYNREYQATKRREKGIKPRGSYIKYRDKGKGKRVDRIPLVEFLEEIMESRKLDRYNLSKLIEVDDSRLRRIMQGKEQDGSPLNKVTLGLVDQILYRLDREEMLTILYDE